MDVRALDVLRVAGGLAVGLRGHHEPRRHLGVGTHREPEEERLAVEQCRRESRDTSELDLEQPAGHGDRAVRLRPKFGTTRSGTVDRGDHLHIRRDHTPTGLQFESTVKRDGRRNRRGRLRLQQRCEKEHGGRGGADETEHGTTSVVKPSQNNPARRSIDTREISPSEEARSAGPVHRSPERNIHESHGIVLHR